MAQKKVYPSQINTKSIACRLPFEEWNKINSHCIENGITINDWLINKLFNSNNETNTINGTGTIKKITKEDVYDFIVDVHMQGNHDNPVPEHCKRFWQWFLQFKTEPNLNEFLEQVRWVVDDLSLYKNENFASTEDIMMQINVLLHYTQWEQKEQSKYRKEVMELINELRLEIEKNDEYKGANESGELWYRKPRI